MMQRRIIYLDLDSPAVMLQAPVHLLVEMCFCECVQMLMNVRLKFFLVRIIFTFLVYIATNMS